MFPNEVLAFIVKSFDACPDYMVARQINRQFRSVCKKESVEERFARLASRLFGGGNRFCFKEILDEYRVLLCLRPIGAETSCVRWYPSTVETCAPDFEESSLWNPFILIPEFDRCVWGFMPNRAKRKVANKQQSPSAQGQLVIAETYNYQANKCLFRIDVSVPDNRLCQMLFTPWEECDEADDETLPYKYITFASSSSASLDTKVTRKENALVRMADIRNSKRLNVYVDWNEKLMKRDPYNIIARSFSRYGVLVVAFNTDPVQFLIIGKPEYIESDEENEEQEKQEDNKAKQEDEEAKQEDDEEETNIDMSQLLDYFHYIVSNNLFRLVACPKGFQSLVFFPLAKENWFGTLKHVFRIPDQSNIPTYQEFLQSHPTQGVSQSHFSACIALDQDCPRVFPDFEAQHSLLLDRPFYDNLFVIGDRSEDGTCIAIVDLRPHALDLLFERTTFTTQMLPVPNTYFVGRIRYNSYDIPFFCANPPGPRIEYFDLEFAG